MNIEGANIYEEGVKIEPDCQEKIRQIVSTLRIISPSPKVSLRIVKKGRNYEGLLWGNANDKPLSAYNRGTSVGQVVDRLYEKVKRECVKALKKNRPVAA